MTMAPIDEDHALATAALARARAAVAPRMLEVLGQVAPQLRDGLAGHLAAGGKFVRGALVLLSATATGGAERDGLDAAAAIELVHNFSLVHDDVIDGDAERRHRPTLWASHGVNTAILAGDALSTLAFQVVLAEATPERLAAASRLADAVQAMIAGQAEDLAFEAASDVTLEECLAMVSGKTAALLGCAASLGAVCCGAPADTIVALSDYGHHLGIAFQAVDDLLGVWGHPEATGKPVGNDLRLRKKTIPVCLAWSRGAALPFPAPDATVDDLAVDELRAALEACGAREATAELCDEHLTASLEALQRVTLEAHPRAQLAAVARYVVGRDR